MKILPSIILVFLIGCNSQELSVHDHRSEIEALKKENLALTADIERIKMTAPTGRKVGYNGLLEMTAGEVAHTQLSGNVREAAMLAHIIRLSKWVPESEAEERQLIGMLVDFFSTSHQDALRSYQTALMCEYTEPKRIEMMQSQLKMIEQSRDQITEILND